MGDVTRWTALGYVAAFAGGAAIASAWRRPEVRIEKTQERKEERNFSGATAHKTDQATTTERRDQERTQERIETRRPDGTVRVVYRDRVRHAEAKERVITKVEVKEVVKWQTKVVEVEKLVETRPAQQRPPRWSVAAGPAWTLSGLSTTAPSGAVVSVGRNLIGPMWIQGQMSRASGETSGALMLGVTF